MPLQLEIKSFIIYYEDTQYSGIGIDDWHKAPTEKVQAVLLRYTNETSEVISNFGVYCMWKNQHGLRFEACNRHLTVYPDQCKPSEIKCSSEMDDIHEFHKVLKMAHEVRDNDS